MKTMKKIVCALMTLVLLLSGVPAAFADEAKTIDQDAACSLTIWKFDYTNAKKDGVWDEDAFPSTCWQESYVENTLVNTNRKGDTDGQNGNALGNGQASKGYAIAGVEFTYLKAADIVTFENQGTTQVLYGFHKTDAANLLKAIGLENGANRCTEADSLDADRYFYTSDTLNKALAQSLEANSTTVKNALETFIRNGGTAMAPTSEVGKTSAKDLSVGLYLLVETKVPEMVTSTTNPFFVSLPMTTVTGNDNSASQNGGAASVGGLYEFPLDIPGLQKEGKPNGNGDAAKRSHKAENDHFGVPHFIEICLCNVQKQHGRQGNLKCELVHLGHKGVIIKSNSPKKISQH